MKATLQDLDGGQKIIPVITKAFAPGMSESTLDATRDYLNAAFKSQESAEEIQNPVSISAGEGQGLEALCDALKKASTSDFDPEKELLLTNARHYGDLLKAGEALRRALGQMQAGSSADFIAMDIREATAALSSLTGAITTPDLLNSIFSHFCIGK